MAQTRKQRVLEQVQRRRRQRTIATVTIVAILIAIIVLAFFLLPRSPPNPVQLPPYLSHCVTGSTAYHSHPHLAITISGVPETIPVTSSDSCSQPIHTHATDGVLHVETDQAINYTLGDWFLLWANFESNPTTAIFNSTQIFGDKAGAGTGHNLNMTVNGSVDINPGDFKGGNPAVFQNLWLPRNAQTGSDVCDSRSCIPFNIAITYT